jgi:hypothetical protein
MANESVIRISLDDVGTRGEHIIHMRDNWVLAYDALDTRKSWMTEKEKKLMADLKIVIDFVNNHLEKDFIDIERLAK